MTKFILYITFISSISGQVEERRYTSANLFECQMRAAGISQSHKVVTWECKEVKEI